MGTRRVRAQKRYLCCLVFINKRKKGFSCFFSLATGFFFSGDFMGPPVLVALVFLGLTSSSSALSMRMPSAVGECKTVYFIRHGQVCVADFISYNQ